ncbi:MAG: sensor histidine kinase [Magnetovibrionaceae bacterium]
MAGTQRRSFFFGLSVRLLALTVLFVMLAELLIWTPSISRYRLNYLQDHLANAHLAALALQATPDLMVSKELEQTLLFHADAYSIALRSADRDSLMLASPSIPMADVSFDLTNPMFTTLIMDAFEALGRDDNRIIRVLGPSPKVPGVTIEVVLDEQPMREAMIDFSNRILALSIFISAVTAGLVFFSLRWLLVKPVHRLTDSMVAFREDPESEAAAIIPTRRSDEIGLAEQELATMQTDLRSALRQKTRLATLGAAVAKVNHDLRNTLATAVLASDRLGEIDDPQVKKLMPRLMDAIDRATDLCSQTLTFASDTEVTLNRKQMHLAPLVDDVAEFLREEASVSSSKKTLPEGFQVLNAIDGGLIVTVDHAQLHRAFANLVRNAGQCGASRVTVTCDEKTGPEGERLLAIDLADNGPGMAEKAQAKLFQPFAGSARKGGTGLGLVIVRDILRAHGGEVELVSTGAEGTRFRLLLPA